MIKIFKLLFKEKMALLATLIITILYVTTTLLTPYLFGIIIDNIDQDITKYLLYSTILVFASMLLNYILLVLNNHIVNNISLSLRKETFRKLDTLPIVYFDNTISGKTLNSIVLNNEQLSDGMLLFLNDFIRNIFLIIGVLIFLFFINYIIALIVFFLTPLTILVTKLISKYSYRFYSDLTKEKAIQTSIINELVKNQKNVIRYNYQDEAYKRFVTENEKYKDISMKATFVSSLVNPSSRLISSIIYALITLVMSLLLIDNDLLTIGTLAALLSYVNQYTKPFNEMTSIISEIQNAVTAYEDIIGFISLDDDVVNNDDLVFNDEKREIVIKDVDFSYDINKPLIKDLNIHIEPGMKVAIVGESGAGKTTLINLIMRFYEVLDGNILINNQDIADYSKKSLRDDIGMVLQDTWIKEDSILNNITMHQDYNKAEVDKILNEVMLKDYVDSLPLGINTIISNQSNLSLGQRQLISIARVMLKKANILLLDEATSNIDILSEQYISKSLDNLMKDKTTIVVAHRLKTIENADLILVMKKGLIVETGNHQELINKNGYYKQLYESQFYKR